MVMTMSPPPPPQQDNSLASRMARRVEPNQSATTTSTTSNFQNDDDDGRPSYHGQILDNDDEEDTNLNKSSWLATTFRCRRHIDHASKGAGGRLEELHPSSESHPSGADGRNAHDEYVVVVDEQRRNTHHPHTTTNNGTGRRGTRGSDSHKRPKGRHPSRGQLGRGYRDNNKNDRERGGGGGGNRDGGHQRPRKSDGRTTSPKQPSSRYCR